MPSTIESICARDELLAKQFKEFNELLNSCVRSNSSIDLTAIENDVRSLYKATPKRLLLYIKYQRLLSVKHLYMVYVSSTGGIEINVQKHSDLFVDLTKILAGLAPKNIEYRCLLDMREYLAKFFNHQGPVKFNYSDGSEGIISYKVEPHSGNTFVLLEYKTDQFESSWAWLFLKHFFIRSPHEEAKAFVDFVREEYHIEPYHFCPAEIIPPEESYESGIYRLIQLEWSGSLLSSHIYHPISVYMLVELYSDRIPVSTRQVLPAQRVVIKSKLSFCGFCHTTSHNAFTCKVAPNVKVKTTSHNTSKFK
ncbi:hypothetical protein DFJ63DRAFT_332706 [Scheffersomyces coipomensis]|uniref:uncharacterized protein n=1 Tax=Scheffersomyces coipomensis TaxID=1788519 RepID=UPI00315D0E08